MIVYHESEDYLMVVDLSKANYIIIEYDDEEDDYILTAIYDNDDIYFRLNESDKCILKEISKIIANRKNDHLVWSLKELIDMAKRICKNKRKNRGDNE